jgi:putative serine/threonine protein kinase
LKVQINSPLISKLISYPRLDIYEYNKRMIELYKIGVKDAILEGPTKICELNILGKGHSGIVLKVSACSKKTMALKIRRIDSRRKDSLTEVYNQKLANLEEIGPQIIENTNDLILMELITGKGLYDWLEDPTTIHFLTSTNIINIVNEILEQCYRLDVLHLDHGELTRIDNHVMVSDNNDISIIDFESASTKRKPCNVTSASQALLLSGGSISRKICQFIEIKDPELLLNCLKKYKKIKNRQNFEQILSFVNGDR